MWCANEALKDIIKLRIRKGVTASLTQDGQGATLSVRMCTISHHRDLSLTWLVTVTSLTKGCCSPAPTPLKYETYRVLVIDNGKLRHDAGQLRLGLFVNLAPRR
jgi:hypothetical protein